ELHHAQMPAIYRQAARSGGCLVSTSSAESFGMAVLEAMACGCPAVAPGIEGLRDLVRHEETGRLYPAGDVAAACDAVLATLNDPPERRPSMAEASHRM